MSTIPPRDASFWNGLASSARWRNLVTFIRTWIGPFDANVGMQPDDLDAILCSKQLVLPPAVREWYLLAAGWTEPGVTRWIRPRELTLQGGLLQVLSDTEGITSWTIRSADLDNDDPPIVSADEPGVVAFPSFSGFVAAMIVNDLIFFSRSGDEPVELDQNVVRAELTCLVSSSCGDFVSDRPLASATVIVFAYPNKGPACGRANTGAGRALLERMSSAGCH